MNMYLHKNTILQEGKYKIVRHISSGGFGNTYEGLDFLLNKRVAIKEFYVNDFCSRDSCTQRVYVNSIEKKPLIEHLKKKFVEEARAIAQMDHDNIIKVQTLFEENDTAYYVMDYIEGESIHEILKHKGSFMEVDALSIISKVSNALGYMHKLGRFHLDVKPGNIMLRNDGKVILIDFGSSKQYAEVGNENTTTIAPCYTSGYAPSEQMNPSTTKFTPATDIYALGATLYKMLTGLTPPSAIDLLNGEECLSPLPTDISEAVRKCIQKAMVPQRRGRIQSIQEFESLLKSNYTSISNKDKVVSEQNTDTFSDEETTFACQSSYEEDSKGVVIHLDGISFRMIYVQGGSIIMQDSDSVGLFSVFSSHARKQVSLSHYYIAEVPVTQELWKFVMGNNPSTIKGEKRPVDSISWEDCQTFIFYLNRITNLNFSLPTEAQWEFAARGGNSSRNLKYAGNDKVDYVAWHWKNSGHQSHEVAKKLPNELGIYDMSGNVSEWCHDYFDAYNSGREKNPQGPLKGSDHVIRGGSWLTDEKKCRVISRDHKLPTCRDSSIGLRLLLNNLK